MSSRFPHTVNTFFCKRVDNLFVTIFEDSGLLCKWWWERCECQKRGTVHISWCFCLGCDPNIFKSAEIVLKDHMAQFSMDKYSGWEFTAGEKNSFPKNSIFSDEWMSDKDLKGNTKRSHPVIDEDVAAENVFSIKEETKHEKIINKFQNWLIYIMNNQEIEDSTSETHNLNTRYKYTMDDLQYPSGLDPVNIFMIT